MRDTSQMFFRYFRRQEFDRDRRELVNAHKGAVVFGLLPRDGGLTYDVWVSHTSMDCDVNRQYIAKHLRALVNSGYCLGSIAANGDLISSCKMLLMFNAEHPAFINSAIAYLTILSDNMIVQKAYDRYLEDARRATEALYDTRPV